MNESWIIVGAGSAGCVIANRLSADPGRQVTLLDSGPSLAPGAVPDGIEGPSFFAAMQEPGRIFPELLATRAAGIEPTVYQRGRGIGGSSAVNAMVALRGSDSLYRSWGWTNVAEAWSRVQIPTELAAMSELGPVDRALLGDDRAEQVQLTRTNGKRVTSAQAYLWPVLERPNLLIRSATAVQRVRINARRATGVILDDGSELEADHVVVCAGAIHSPVVLLRSGVDTPFVGAGLQDHPSVVFTLVLRDHAHHDAARLPIGSALHTYLGADLVQLLPMSNLGPGPETTGLGAVMAALMTPTGRSGSVNIDQAGSPVIDFALLDDPHDVAGLVAAAELTISLLRTRPFDEIAKHVHIDDRGTTVDAISDTASIKRWVLAHCGDYVHATSTCAMGTVVDEGFAVTGYQNLYVCDASVFPSIPDANTHLPTTMVAERFALEHS
ncbi:MAG: GMC family oxidoreductase [Acidimicrobiales bacterium]